MANETNLVALVTGANRGIGLETARQLGAEGVTVVMAGRSEAAIHDAARTLEAEGHAVVPVVMDVTNDEQIEAVRARMRFGLGWSKSASMHTGQCPVMKCAGGLDLSD